MGKRDDIQLHEDMAKIAELMHMGITSKSELADRINAGRPKEMHVSRQTIANDIERLKSYWKESAMYDFNEAWHQTMDEYSFLKKLAFQDFMNSRGIKLTITTEHGKDASFEEIMGENDELTPEQFLAAAQDAANGGKTIIKKELREGNVAYLQLIERIIEKQAKMRGVDGANKIALTKADGQDVGSITDNIISSLAKVKEQLSKSEEDLLQDEADAMELENAPFGLLEAGVVEEDDA
jgi:hypothetical protein